jgi:putative transposase
MVGPSARRAGVDYLLEQRGYSQRQASRLVGICRSSVRYVAKQAADEVALAKAVWEQAHKYPSYGYRRVTVMLRRAGWTVNVKRVHRLWRKAGLQVPRRKAIRRRAGQPGDGLKRAEYANHVWTYDFMSGRTERGNKVRILNILDEYTRECLFMLVAPSIASKKVIQALEWLFLSRGTPAHLRSDNGPEFVAYAVQDWLKQRKCQTLYITPGSPWENPFIESFNGHFRAELLDRVLFANGQEAKHIIEHWRLEYNHHRPHSSLGYATPAEFAAQVGAAQHPPAPVDTLSLELVHS